MAINILDENTINKIAAGEVVERPSSVVKELVENAIDAGATAITVEIKEGGISFIRITDNGQGIPASDVRVAFLRHSTSKIRSAEDLISISSLGFRGEALSSICAVAQVELVTKTREELSGTRYQIDGGVEKAFEEVGAPDGTTFLVRNLFYNTPARRKFLKTPGTEGGYISSIIEHLCMSHPDISFRFIVNNQPKIQTMGNGNLKDSVYTVYGREITHNLLEIDRTFETFSIKGYIGKPIVSRGNRNFENYYINGRYIKSSIVSKAIEDAYGPFIMLHKYPFTAFHITIDSSLLDVNVHPSKLELRFSNSVQIYEQVKEAVTDALTHKELIPDVELEVKKEKRPVADNVSFTQAPKPQPEPMPEPVPKTQPTLQPEPVPRKVNVQQPIPVKKQVTQVQPVKLPSRMPEPFENKRSEVYKEALTPVTYNQMELFDKPELLKEENKPQIRIIGQVFDTYWIIEFEKNMYIIDQHAAHEKVLFERFMKTYNSREITTQQVSPPVILSLTVQEQELLKTNMEHFSALGFEIEEFGGDEYAIRGIPADFSEANHKELLLEILDSLEQEGSRATIDTIKYRIATMACKAAVKGNNKLSHMEAAELINELMELDNPYNCPHGRPTMIFMSKYELEKKFKRIV